tara:strand:+ start:12299 stop:13156 length:858 start_codon:yes stop_codon:yes gene_type:complete
MLFTNVTPYRFSKEFRVDDTELEMKLGESMVREMGDHESYIFGWDKYNKLAESLFLEIGGCYLLKLVKLEKVIPNSAINKELADRIDVIESENSYKVGRKQKQELKDQIFMERLPTAMVVEKPVYICIDVPNQTLIVNTSSANSSDDATSYLRKTLGSLPIVPMVSESSPALRMTSWISGNEKLPENFQILNTAKLRNSEGVSVSFTDFVIDDYIADLVGQGMECKELRMSFKEEATFTLTSDLKIKTIKWDFDDDNEYDDALDAMHSTFYILSHKVNNIISKLM